MSNVSDVSEKKFIPVQFRLNLNKLVCYCSNLKKQIEIELSKDLIRAMWKSYKDNLQHCLEIKIGKNGEIPEFFVGFEKVEKDLTSFVKSLAVKLREDGCIYIDKNFFKGRKE